MDTNRLEMRLKDALQAVNQEFRNHGVQVPASPEDYAPPSVEVREKYVGAPPDGVNAHRSLSSYGYDLANYTEQVGQKAIEEAEARVVEAKQFAACCADAAARIRKSTDYEASRAIRFTRKLDRMGQALEVSRQIEEEPL